MATKSIKIECRNCGKPTYTKYRDKETLNCRDCGLEKSGVHASLVLALLQGRELKVYMESADEYQDSGMTEEDINDFEYDLNNYIIVERV